MILKGLYRYPCYLSGQHSQYKDKAYPRNISAWDFDGRYSNFSSCGLTRKAIPNVKMGRAKPSRTSRLLKRSDSTGFMGLYAYYDWRMKESSGWKRCCPNFLRPPTGVLQSLSLDYLAYISFVSHKSDRFSCVFTEIHMHKLVNPNQGIYSCPYGVGVE